MSKSTKIDYDQIQDIVERVIKLHILARELITDDEMLQALALYRQRSHVRRVPSHADVATLLLLRAVQQFRKQLPPISGDSPFDYPDRD